MIKGVIFDLGGVLLDNPAANMRKFISESLNISEEEFIERISLPIIDFQKGLISEEKFWQKVTKGSMNKTNIHGSLWKEAIKVSFSPKKKMLSLIDDLRNNGLKIGILSNTEAPVVEYLQEIEFGAYDINIYSCIERTCKPERGIYLLAIERFGMKPNELVFIDDTLENIIAGQSIGLNSILFKTIDQVKDDLRKLISEKIDE